MDIAPTLLLATVLWQAVDWLREISGAVKAPSTAGRWSAPLTQLCAWVGGVIVVILAAHSGLFDGFTVNGQTLTTLDGGSQVFLGLGIASFASTGADIKSALDGSDTAKKPPLVGP